MASSQPRTIPRLFEDSVQRFSQKVMMWEKKEGAYKGTTYREIEESVHQCAAGLMSLGVEKGDRIGLIAEGRNDWVIAELGILFVGAINVPLSVKLEERSDLKFRLAHSGCRMVVVSGGQAHKIARMRVDLPDLEKIIHLDPLGTLAVDEIGFPELLAQGKEYCDVIDPISRNDGSQFRKMIRRPSATLLARRRTRKVSPSPIATILRT